MNSSQNRYSHVQWSLDITNLYITKSSVQRTIFLTLVIAKYMKKYLDITKPRYSKQIFPVHWHFVIFRFHCSSSASVYIP